MDAKLYSNGTIVTIKTLYINVNISINLLLCFFFANIVGSFAPHQGLFITPHLKLLKVFANPIKLQKVYQHFD